MNPELFYKLMKRRPSQHAPEWELFLEICELYMMKRRIKKPVVVEIGTWKGRQKVFYEQILGAEHIGIDITSKRSTPDILGDSHDPKTLETLIGKLDGRPINILFIDGDHHYEDVKKDFEMYSLYCSDIIVLHDIELGRTKNKDDLTVWKFWDELKEKAIAQYEKYSEFMFITISQAHFHRKGDRGAGIGLIIK